MRVDLAEQASLLASEGSACAAFDRSRVTLGVVAAADDDELLVRGAIRQSNGSTEG